MYEDEEYKSIQAMPLFWGDKDHLNAILNSLGERKQIDMILAADTVFDFENFDGLIKGIFDGLHDINPNIEILCCFSHRFGDVERWFREGIEKRGFTEWTELAVEEYPEQF
jgi:hypothetical protein